MTMSSAAAVLERRPTGVLPDPERWGDLPDRTEAELGYELPRQLRDEEVLDCTLAKLGIQPFTGKSVSRYKMLAIQRQQPVNHLLMDLLGHLTVSLIFGGLLLTVGGSFFDEPTLFKIAAYLFSAGFVLVLPLSKAKIIKPGEWRMRSLTGYDKPIPQPVLKTALRIRTSLPRADFEVYEFFQEEVLDPFLVVSYGDTKYLIEVWDEPDFEAEPSA